jgi:hypothetical protein
MNKHFGGQNAFSGEKKHLGLGKCILAMKEPIRLFLFSKNPNPSFQTLTLEFWEGEFGDISKSETYQKSREE